MKKLAYSSLVGALSAIAGPAFAADLSVASPALAAPPAAPISNSIGLEVSPEFWATPPGDGKVSNSLDDAYIKGFYSHTFSNGFNWGASLQYTSRVSNNSYQLQPETTLGYNLKLSPTLTMPVSVGVGYLSNSDPTYFPAQNFAYYVFNAGLNVKLDAHWTWNAISARYRDAFIGNWVTPKLATGVTYTIDPHNAVYLNAGYAWQTDKNYANALEPNKWNIALGYKYGF